MRDTVNVLGVNIDKISFAEALEKAKKLIDSEGVSMIFTPNPEIIMIASEDEYFKEILNSADICTPDGIGVVYAAKILKNPVKERVPGFELSKSLLEYAAKTGDGVFFFGAKPGVADKAKAKVEKMYPGLKVAGTHDGYFKPEDEAEIINQINESGAKILFVCLGAPKQEKWIYENRGKLKAGLCLGVGGTLDVLSGEAKRAPEIFLKLNLEWLYRIASNPSRWGRFFALPGFMLRVIREKRKIKIQKGR